MPQPQPGQPFGFNDMPMLQRQIMFKQLQELQRRQQLQELGDSRQQNYIDINQLSAINRQVSGGQFPPLINGTPVHDAQKFMAGNINMALLGGLPAGQGFPNAVLSQAQSQALQSVDHVPQQFNTSYNETTIASPRNNLSQYSFMQGVSNDSINVSIKAPDNQAERLIKQPSASANSLVPDSYNLSPNLHCMLDGAYSSKQVPQGKSMSGKISGLGLDDGFLTENIQQRNASPQEFRRQEQASWPGLFSGKLPQVNHSSGMATLDPLEEKILFNMDDNNWNATFDLPSESGPGGFGNPLESTDYLSSFPSVQSGSWSALMQSAVAEASSSDTGLQEEWSGLSFQNTELSADNQPTNFVDSGKQQTRWVGNSIQSTPSLNSKPQLLFSDSNIGSAFPGFQQSGIQFPIYQTDGKYSASSPDSLQHSGKNVCNPHQKQLERNQPTQILLPPDNGWPCQINGQSETGIYQQRLSSLNSGGQPLKRQTSGKIESPSPRRNDAPSISNIEHSVSKYLGGDNNRAMYLEMNPGSGPWKNEDNSVANSFPYSLSGLDQLKSGIDDSKFERENSQLNIYDDVPSCIPKAEQETNAHISEGHHQLEHMKNVANAMIRQRKESVRDDRHHHLTDETYDKQQNCYQRENSSDSYHSNTSKQITTRHDLRECLHDGDSQPMGEGNRMLSGQIPYQPFSQGFSSQEQGYPGQFNLMCNVSEGAVKMEKGGFPDVKIYSNTEQTPPRGNTGANMSASTERSVGFNGPNETSQPSRNMLQLLPNGDHVRLNTNCISFGSSDSKLQLRVPKGESPGAFAAQQYDYTSASQHFGLRLAPPSQQLPNSYSVFSSQTSPQMVSSTAISSSAPSYMKNQQQRQHFSSASMTLQQPQPTLPSIASGSPHSNRPISQNSSPSLPSKLYGEQFPILEAAPVTEPFVMLGMSQQVPISGRPPGRWTNVSTHPNLSGKEAHRESSSLLLPSFSTVNNLKTTSRTPRESHDRNVYVAGATSPEFGAGSLISKGFDRMEEQPVTEMSQHQTSLETLDSGSEPGALSHGQEPPAKHLLEESAITSSALITCTQRDLDMAQHVRNKAQTDLEAFGRSLKPLHSQQQNYSLLHQHTGKNADTGASKGFSEMYYGTNPNLIAQQVHAVAGHNLMYGHNSGGKSPSNTELNAALRLPPLPSKDSEVLTLPSDMREGQSVEGSSQPLYLDTPQTMFIVGQSTTQNQSSSNTAYQGTEHSQNRLQMESSWFKHKNGQMLPKYDAKAASSAIQQVPPGSLLESWQMNSSMASGNATVASQIVGCDHIVAASTLIAGDRSAPDVLSQEVIDQQIAVVRPKKRKFAVSSRVPWHKEVTGVPLQTEIISMAELKWAKATNRLVEKLEDVAKLTSDVQPVVRPKKRLILTTKLMQQVFQPAPASILSVDATSNYDSLAYFAARLALGEACSLTSCSRNESCSSSNNCDTTSEKSKVRERPHMHYFSKIVGDFTRRAQQLESDFLRLEKMASVLDTKGEIQELEKFSVINRFAKFHIRGQADVAVTSSLSSASPNAVKIFPQRYVTVFPMPETVPDQGAQCFSL